MKILLQEITPPIAELSNDFKKIILTNGEQIYLHDIPTNEYQELALHALEKNTDKKSNWKTILNTVSGAFNPIKKKVFQHVTKSRNILCITADAPYILHHSSFVLNPDSEITPITSQARANILEQIREHASQGNSVSGIGIKRIESHMNGMENIHNEIFIGIALHEYSLLPETSTTIDALKNSNVSIKIFSKELLPTCKSIARKLGVHASDDFCITSDAIQSMSDTELITHLPHTNVFAEMKPLDKDRVTRLLKTLGHELHN